MARKRGKSRSRRSGGSRKTSKKLASEASRVLRSKRSSKKIKRLAASVLGQRGGR